MIAELVRPQLGNRIGDPACGTGGFLLGAYQYIVTDIARKSGNQDLKPDEDGFVRTSVSAAYDQKSKAILDKCLFGYDIDSTMIRLGMMNLMMHGIDEPLLDYKDTLSKKFNEPNQYQIIMANPPFTGSGTGSLTCWPKARWPRCLTRKKTAWRSGLSHDPAAPENKRAVPMPAAGI